MPGPMWRGRPLPKCHWVLQVLVDFDDCRTTRPDVQETSSRPQDIRYAYTKRTFDSSDLCQPHQPPCGAPTAGNSSNAFSKRSLFFSQKKAMCLYPMAFKRRSLAPISMSQG